MQVHSSRRRLTLLRDWAILSIHSCVILLLVGGDVGTCSAQTPVKNSKLTQLIQRGRETHSDAVIVIQNGKILAEEYFEGSRDPIYIASAGKSLTSLAIGKLLDQGKIKDLDQPVSDFYPQWLQGNKKQITVRMLLNHTSGIQNVPNASVEIEWKYPPVNAIELAIAAELSHQPGSKFSYNNKAVALLGGIIEVASGKRMDKYFEDEFYRPMGIDKYGWIADEDGNPLAYGGHKIEPMGLAKFGLLILNGGELNGKRIVSKSFIEQALKPGQQHFAAAGLLWWRYPAQSFSVVDSKKLQRMREDGIDPEFIAKVSPLENIRFNSNSEYFAANEKIFGANWNQKHDKAFEKVDYVLRRRSFSDEIIGYYAAGSRGNYVLVMPNEKLVAIRVVGNDAEYDWQSDGFQDFLQLAAGLTGKQVEAPPIQ